MEKGQRVEADLESYFRSRLECLPKRIFDTAAELFGKDAVKEDRDFEDEVERRLRNGAKFVRRKLQSS